MSVETVFFATSAVAVISTALAISRSNAVHALLYFVVSLLSISLLFFILGAPFAAALEVITYAGAVVVLFLFVVMMLGLSRESLLQEKTWIKGKIWVGPGILGGIITVEFVLVLAFAFTGADARPRHNGNADVFMLGPTEVGRSLFGPYALGVEIASLILLAALIGATHVGREWPKT